ncbi:nucleoside hydrolase-like domain-containing protein [Leptothoe kymatousa]|uniref:DUF1593 domain-containing protein n=1 Tax=Leptothoe kymatousa TAU-MAC 1615 TaxID=2364775 RepID=A0ABS5XZD7_9CYAN|nr:nucleoside hydrolase-like domain-containing protein [Leptothoe kymatousa]MBT9310741.1 DUF1593 domain-containing protein [Leptothoe kymatousa TAU-MAC 1615]
MGSCNKSNLRSVAQTDAQTTDPGPSILSDKPRIIVISDIQVGKGDPDDRQSMAHLMMYANEVDIRGIWPDNLDIGLEGTEIVLDHYDEDYNNPAYQFQSLNYPSPEYIRSKVFSDHDQAIAAVRSEAQADDPRPLYMLVWGGTHRVVQSLEKLTPEEQGKIRLISIGTYLRDNAFADGDGQKYNWNAWGESRMDIWNRFPEVWWLEMDWSWNGMAFNQDLSIANAAKELNQLLAENAGALGGHIQEVFPKYFRSLDTNSLLYLLDPANDLDDPTGGSWAGQYHRPFADRPNYYTGIDGGYDWAYDNPASTWQNARDVFVARMQTCIDQRSAWHQSFQQKVVQLYGHDAVESAPET